MTSNIGSDKFYNEDQKPNMQTIISELKLYFKPEFINRIDEIVLFHPLTREVQFKIVQKLLNDLKMRLEANNIKITFTDELCKHILDESYDINFGARPLKRYIQKNVETIVAKDIITSTIKPNESYTVDYVNGEIVVKHD